MTSWNYLASIDYGVQTAIMDARAAARGAAADAFEQRMATQAVQSAVERNTDMLDRIREDLRASTASITGSIGELEAVTAEGFTALAARLDLAQQTLEQIQQTVANPAMARVREAYIAGVQALRLGLLPEAANKFRSALEQDEMQKYCQWALAVALYKQGDRDGAFHHLTLAFRYSEVESSLHLAGAVPNPHFRGAIALMAKEIATGEEQDQVYAMVAEARQTMNYMPRLAYTHARMAEERGDEATKRAALEEAFRTGPEYALLAVREGVRDAEPIAEEVFATTPAFAAMRRIIEAYSGEDPTLDPTLYDEASVMMSSYPALVNRYATVALRNETHQKVSEALSLPHYDGSWVSTMRDKIERLDRLHQQRMATAYGKIGPKPGALAGRKARDAYAQRVGEYERVVASKTAEHAEAETKLAAYEAQYAAAMQRAEELRAQYAYWSQLNDDMWKADVTRVEPFFRLT